MVPSLFNSYLIQFRKSTLRTPLFAPCVPMQAFCMMEGLTSRSTSRYKNTRICMSYGEPAKPHKFCTTSDFGIIRVDCLFTAFLVEHNIPLSVSGCTGPHFWKIFSKCDEAKCINVNLEEMMCAGNTGLPLWPRRFYEFESVVCFHDCCTCRGLLGLKALTRRSLLMQRWNAKRATCSSLSIAFAEVTCSTC